VVLELLVKVMLVVQDKVLLIMVEVVAVVLVRLDNLRLLEVQVEMVVQDYHHHILEHQHFMLAAVVAVPLQLQELAVLVVAVQVVMVTILELLAHQILAAAVAAQEEITIQQDKQEQVVLEL
jgi:hypothetical protein